MVADPRLTLVNFQNTAPNNFNFVQFHDEILTHLSHQMYISYMMYFKSGNKIDKLNHVPKRMKTSIHNQSGSSETLKTISTKPATGNTELGQNHFDKLLLT